MSNNDDFEKYSKYAVDQIKTVIDTYGPRPPGSKAESDAALYIQGEMEKYTDEVKSEPFKLAPKAFMGFIPLVCIFLIASIVFYWIYPLVGLLLTGISALITVLEFLLYKQAVDWLFPKATSHNVIGIKRPSGEVKRYLMVGGHIDSAFEWTFNKSGKPIVIRITIISAIGGLFFALIANLLRVIFTWNEPVTLNSFWGIVGIVLVCFIPVAINFIRFSNFKVVSPGANDNLSGVFSSIAVAKLMKDKGISLKNTEVWFFQTGSEEAGLRGAKAYVKAHAEELKTIEKLYLGIDTLRDLEFMAVYNKDLNGTVALDERGARLLKEAASKAGHDLDYASVFLGSSDAAAFMQGGVPSILLAAQDPAPLNYYHTRFDTVDNLNENAIKEGIKVVLAAVQLYDEKGLEI